MSVKTKTPVALLKCKNKKCKNFKFAHDDSWEKVFVFYMIQSKLC